MKGNKQIFLPEHKVTAIFMVFTLVWLTISTPFVFAAAQQQQTCASNTAADEESPADEINPFGNTTEEKAESGSNSISEYHHDMHELVHPAGTLPKHNGCHDADVYVAFHGELLTPPPNFILS
jgi:hypothetical protein